MIINIGKRKIGNNFSTYFVAEIGVNHCGNTNLAKKMILAAKKSGADAVKFQTFNKVLNKTLDTISNNLLRERKREYQK